MRHLGLATSLVLGASAPAFADDQLALSLGVKPDTLSISELTQVKASGDNGSGNSVANDLIDRFTYDGVSTKSTGISPGQAQIAANLGLDASEFTVAELVNLKALIDSDSDNSAYRSKIEQLRIASVVSTMNTGISPGQAQLAANLGVNPLDYSFVELVNLKASFDPTDPTN